MELTFVHQYGDSAPKRRRLAKACESCRARKKRCVHFSGLVGSSHLTSNPTVTNGKEQTNGHDSEQTQSPPISRGNEREDSSPSIRNARKFISDLNPEATFLQRSTSLNERDREPNDDIGVWIDKREWEELVRQKNSTGVSDSAVFQGQRPDPSVVDRLIDIYFMKIHPILPLLDEAEFRRNHVAGKASETLTLALCLVAAKDSEAESYLRLKGSSSATSPREFCTRIHATVMEGLRIHARFEKITLIRILALTSLHAEGQDGPEEASMCLTQAMHYIHTLGWHLGQQASVASGDDLTTKRLFWCLWCLDRINSAMYSRPIMMSNIDIAIETFETDESGFPAFEVWLRICDMLDKVIAFYRPGKPLTITGWEEDYPSFEEIAGEGRVWALPQSILATLHLFYLLIAVLSHRSRGVKYMPRGLPSYIRQSLCSIEIRRLMDSHLFTSLHPLPILPYAISLALSVSYQHLRQAQLQHQQEDARDDFRVCCQVLQKLRRTWSSADVIATISKKVLGELDKATDLSSFRVSRFTGERDSPCPASLNKPDTLLDGVTNSTSADGDTALDGTTTAVDQQPSIPVEPESLFEGMDDIFGTYLDPNYPLYLDDFSLSQDVSPLDWSVNSS